MRCKYVYWSFANALNNETCDKIINQGLDKIAKSKKLGLDTSGTTHGNSHKQANLNATALSDKPINEYLQDNKKHIKDVYIRDSDISWMSDSHIYDLIIPFVQKANYSAGWKYDLDYYEAFQFTVYKPGGFYNWHQDGGNCHNSKYRKLIEGVTNNTDNVDGGPFVKSHNFVGKVRKLSVTVNLTEPTDYDGGNLKFDLGPHTEKNRYYECEESRPRGSIIVFPSDMYHQVTPITRGTRYSLVLWCLGKPFR